VSVPRRRRVALILLVIVAAAGCLALGWWQWSRFESTTGSFQNLGYALQWPLFAGFCVYAYRKFVSYEETPPQPNESDGPTELPAGLLPERPAPSAQPQDATMREYNAYLAELAKSEQGGPPAAGSADQNRTTA
jgi:DNA-binding transcriptional regulator of glucitol operon